jgi:uncharacterized protein
MHLNVAQLIQEPTGSARSYDLDEEVFTEDQPDSFWIKGNVRLLRTDQGVLVSASLESEVACTCSRCLDEYAQAVEIEMQEEALPATDPPAGSRPGCFERQDDGPMIDEFQILDLSDAVRQYAALSVPMKPVCRLDCKGLCATCGTNLNWSPCRCDKVVRGVRWGPLFDLVATNETAESRKN